MREVQELRALDTKRSWRGMGVRVWVGLGRWTQKIDNNNCLLYTSDAADER